MVPGTGCAGMISDWECLDLARAGDERAWRELYQRHHARLARMTAWITGSMDSAQDLVQECFVRLLDCKVKHREGSFAAFVSTIAHRLALKERARTAVRRRGDLEVRHDDAPIPLEALVKDENEMAVAQVIEALPETFKEVIALRYYGEHSYEEIAEITGVPLGTVKSRIFHAVRRCREDLSKKGVQP